MFQSSAAAVYILLILVLIIIARLMVTPVKFFLKVVYKSAIGVGVLFVLNLFGSWLGFHFAINPLTALMTGALGIPGILTLYFLQAVLP